MHSPVVLFFLFSLAITLSEYRHSLHYCACGDGQGRWGESDHWRQWEGRGGGSGAPIKDLLPSLAPFPSPSSFYGPVQSPDDVDAARVPSPRQRRRRRLTTKDEEEARFPRTFVPLVSELRDSIWREELLLLLTFLSPSPPLRSVVVDVVISRLRIRPPCTHGQRRGRVCPPRPPRKWPSPAYDNSCWRPSSLFVRTNM